MQINSDSLLLKPLAIKQGTEIDEVSLSDVKRAVSEIAVNLPEDALVILRARNTDLLKLLESTENRLISLLYITNKPKQIKKEFSDAIKEYERIGKMLEQYTKRHSQAAH